MKNINYYILSLLLISSLSLKAQLVGHWNFDDKDNLLNAEVGKNLILIGEHEFAEGADNGDGAIRIGVGSHYFVNHGISTKGDQKKVNEYSIVLDIKIPVLNRKYALFQTDIKNTTDAECFINRKGEFGADETWYSPTALKANEWYRIGVSIRNREIFIYYLDGFNIFRGYPQRVDSIFSLDSNGLLLFADNNEEDNEIYISDIKIFSKALSNKEMQKLGGYHTKPDVVIAPPDSVIYPYLQSSTDSSIYICWHASNSPQSVVNYGKTNKLGLSQSGDVHIFLDSTTYHTVKLSNLEPNTTYYYQAISDTMKSKIFSLKTAPSLGEKEGHLRFAIFGDTRTYPAQTEDVITALREKVTKLYGNPNIEENLNLVLCNGDIVHYGPNLSQYKREWFMPMSGISANVPIMVAIGDHEHEANHYYEYMKYEDFGGVMGEAQYAFKYGRALFISEHSISNAKNNIKFRKVKLQWLDNLLQETEKDTTIDWVFVFTHRPGHSEMWPNGNEGHVQNEIIPILSKYKKVDLLTYGHTHAYARGQVTNSNLRLLENGGGGAEIDRWREYSNQMDYPEFQRSHDYWCYTIIDIDIANKRYEGQSFSLGHGEIDMGNKLFDSFFRDKLNETPPQKPDGITQGVQPYPIILKASEYSGTYEILSSQFQVTSVKGNYKDKLIVDAKRDFENLYSDSGAPDFIPIDKNKGIDLTKYWLELYRLKSGKTCWWRVRYRDRNLQWSDWSEEVSVTAVSKKTE